MAFDAALAACLVALGLATMSAEVRASLDTADEVPDLHPVGVTAVALLLSYTLPVALRRRTPVVAFCCVVTGVCVAYGTHYPAEVGSVSALVVLYTVGVLLERAQAVTLLGLALAAYVVVTLVDGVADTFWTSFLSAGIYVAAWALGRSIRYRRAYTAELESRAQRLESEREADLRATLAEERSRIARELHDVVAHSLSVMTVQAAAAQRTVDRDVARSKEAMAAVESTGRAALGEMRRIVGVLREEGQTTAELAPSPGMADLPALVGQVREAGLAVDVDLCDPPLHVPAGVDLTVYRIVQEALTNTLKHAGPAAAVVRVACEPGAICVAVEDSGRGAAAVAAPPGTRSGHGLVGMQERVALYGGSLRVGPRAGGGYAVHARIPVDAVAP
ncbi:signal transduction histidine kinase [Motilibacter peucedani]|uniref:histidine kinase n=2 Tax=Motilibacter peucedani TaxID=598650 RepID=A0A420XK87_9ACTN|nr:signal transduction histidine kinase [Motilibacter peucedani]